MRSLTRAFLVLATLVAFSAHADLRAGAVYLMTNQPENSVIAYERLANGTLLLVGEFPTGGIGDPVPQGADRVTNPLGSQGSLVLSDDGRFLYAVNAGSANISVFAVDTAALRLLETQKSGGTRPISVTARGKFAYVLNEGGTPNIVGFNINLNGRLKPLENSKRTLPSGTVGDPAQVAFNPTGKTLVVTEKATNLVVTYRVGLDGLTLPPVITPSNGITPSGFAFDGAGHLLVSEAAAGVAEESSVSSYQFLPGGVLDSVSNSIPDFQTGAGWVVVTLDKRFVYASNTGSGSISSYQLRTDGRISLLDENASETKLASRPIDLALSRDGRHLYVHFAGKKSIGVFEIDPDGLLNRRKPVLEMPIGAQGIAAN